MQFLERSDWFMKFICSLFLGACSHHMGVKDMLFLFLGDMWFDNNLFFPTPIYSNYRLWPNERLGLNK